MLHSMPIMRWGGGSSPAQVNYSHPSSISQTTLGGMRLWPRYQTAAKTPHTSPRTSPHLASGLVEPSTQDARLMPPPGFPSTDARGVLGFPSPAVPENPRPDRAEATVVGEPTGTARGVLGLPAGGTVSDIRGVRGAPRGVAAGPVTDKPQPEVTVVGEPTPPGVLGAGTPVCVP
jgi:hypothetical protein